MKLPNNKPLVLGGGLIFLASIILLTSILTPFLLHSNTQFHIAAASADMQGCGNIAQLDSTTRCMGWSEPNALSLVTMLGIIAVTTTTAITAFSLRFITQQRNQARNFAGAYILATVATVGIAAIAYVLLQPSSQNVLTLAHKTTDDSWLPVVVPTLGYGIKPFAVVILCTIFLSGPIMVLYRHFLSRRHIAGIKKDRLFQ